VRWMDCEGDGLKSSDVVIGLIRQSCSGQPVHDGESVKSSDVVIM
jgi:hypothetical protein